MVDSGASATVIGEDMLKAIELKPGKVGVEYEVADGAKIPNLGQKEFVAYTDEGLKKKMKVQVTQVNKALLSVFGMVQAGNRVIFDTDGSYVENKRTGEWSDIAVNERGQYILKMWIPKAQDAQEHPF